MHVETVNYTTDHTSVCVYIYYIYICVCVCMLTHSKYNYISLTQAWLSMAERVFPHAHITCLMPVCVREGNESESSIGQHTLTQRNTALRYSVTLPYDTT